MTHSGEVKEDGSRSHRTRLRALLDTCLSILVVAGISHAEAPAESPHPFTLATRCPPSFELTRDRKCRFRSLYELYSSAQGQGGLRVGLPSLSDGFSPQQIDLGRLLFFDPLLSGNHQISCAHCHHPDLGFADGRGRSFVPSKAEGGQAAKHPAPPLRGAPTLWNVGFLRNLFWDGRAHSLDGQAAGPLHSINEMANTTKHLERDLNARGTYRRLFAEAFHLNERQPVTAALVTRALMAFEATLVSLNSRYDRYAHGDDNALTEQERRGYATFRGIALGCSQCHTPPLFTNDQVEVTGVPNSPGQPFDPGVGAITNQPALRGAFRTPTLRNIARTAPYMHSGQFATLDEVVRFYNDRAGHAVPAEEHLHIDWRMGLTRPVLSDADVSDLVAFLGALTDETMTPAVPDRVPSGLHVVGRVKTGPLKATGSSPP